MYSNCRQLATARQ